MYRSPGHVVGLGNGGSPQEAEQWLSLAVVGYFIIVRLGLNPLEEAEFYH